MPNMTSDQLRDISVRVVEDFLNSKVPLSQGLAKQAALHDLNSEQIQRCVEASNTICHLKLMSLAEDRTFEFPLCKYAEVLREAAAPDFEKSAGILDKAKAIAGSVKGTFKDAVGKGAAAESVTSAKKFVEDAKDYVSTASGSKRKIGGVPESTIAKGMLESAKKDMQAAVEGEAAARNLAQTKISAGVAGGMALGGAGYLATKHVGNKAEASKMQKSASFEGNDASASISDHERTIHFIKEAAANDRAVEDLAHRSETLRVSLVKLAQEVSKDVSGLDKIACVVNSDDGYALTKLVFGEPKSLRDFGAGKDGLFKTAELKQVATLQELYKEAKQVSTELTHRLELQKRANALREELTKQAFLGKMVGAVGGAIGKGIGSVLGAAGKVATKPFRDVGHDVFGKVKSLATKTPAQPISGTSKALMAGGAFAGNTALNASILGHQPGVNTVTGRSKDVWSSLQS